jgi:hypothetical protein
MGKSAQYWVKPNRRELSRLRLQYEDHNTEFGISWPGGLWEFGVTMILRFCMSAFVRPKQRFRIEIRLTTHPP